MLNRLYKSFLFFLENNVTFRSLIKNIILLGLSDKPKGAIQIGRHSGILPGAPRILSWRSDEQLIIGKYCMFPEDWTILLGGEHDFNRPTCYIFKKEFRIADNENKDSSTKGPVIIGNDVWIGTGTIVLSGVTIGDGAIVGAGSVVTHNVPPYSIAVGNPARVIRFRFSESQITNLLKIAWWNWDDVKIKENIELLYGNVDTFINKFLKNDE
jgi:acetyltransferase-like isoleucine patch superfamily enzyme